jgi:acyl-CoA thioesterase-1
MLRSRPIDSPFRFASLIVLPLILACNQAAPAPDREAETETEREAGQLDIPIGDANSMPASDIDTEVSVADSTQTPRIVFLGDSLTAGFGLGEEQAFPALIGDRLAERGISVTIVNAGVSGDTTAGGLNRLTWLLRQQPDILVVGLGANDGLRGLSVTMTEENLRSILTTAGESGAILVLLGMKLPPNLGSDYVVAFESIYPRLAQELEVALVPFMLDGVAGEARFNLPDGVHPNAEGQAIVADNLLPWIEEAIERL